MSKNSPIVGWRNYRQNYDLEGVACVCCHKMYYPKKYLCECGSIKFLAHKFSGRGQLLTFTIVHHTSEVFEKMLPYIVGIIELEAGVRVLAQIVDVDHGDLFIGMHVQVVFRKLRSDGSDGIVNYAVKFTKI